MHVLRTSHIFGEGSKDQKVADVGFTCRLLGSLGSPISTLVRYTLFRQTLVQVGFVQPLCVKLSRDWQVCPFQLCGQLLRQIYHYMLLLALHVALVFKHVHAETCVCCM